MSGIDATFDFLAETMNESASDLLIDLLDSKDRDMRERALTAILKRRECLGHAVLLLRWQDWSDRWKGLIAQYSHHVAPAIKEAIGSPDVQLQSNGCDAGLWCRDYDLVSDLANAVLTGKSEELVTRGESTLVRLCEMLSEELFANRESRRGHDPSLARRFVMGELESALRRMGDRIRPALIESYLLLATKETSFLRCALDNSGRALGQAMTERLVSSNRPGVMRVIIDLLQMQHVPAGAAQAASQRCDVPFVRRMFNAIGVNPADVVARNTARITEIAWLDPQRSVLTALDSDEQAAAVAFVCRSGVEKETKLEFLRMVFEKAGVSGRLEAGKGIGDIRGSEANELVVQAFEDEDARVRAIVAPQLRSRSIPGATKRLLACANSEDPTLSRVVKECLADFTFQSYLNSFDKLDEESRWDTGKTVAQVDENVLEELLEEIESSSRMRRLQALRICPTLELINEVSPIVLSMLYDEDAFTRSAAATALGYCNLPSAAEALEQTLQDSNSTVVQAARESLSRLGLNPQESSGAETAETPVNTSQT